MLNKILLVLLIFCSSSCVLSYDEFKIRIEQSGLKLGQVAEIVYETHRMWPLLMVSNGMLRENDVVPLHSTLNIVSPELCVQWMSYSCLQVYDYLQEKAKQMNVTAIDIIKKKVDGDNRISRRG